MMLTYDNTMNDDSMYFDTNSEWSLQKTTKLLADESLYSTDLLGYSGPDCSEISPKIKTESIVDPLSADVSYDGWQSKFIDNWDSHDCLLWLIHELQDLKVAHPLTEVKMEPMALMSGVDLKNMDIHSFNEMFPEYGYELYHRLQKFKARYNYIYDPWNNPLERSGFMTPPQPQEPTTLTDLDSESHSAPFTERQFICPEEESRSSIETPVAEPQPVVPEKRRPGRPRGTRKKKKPEKLGRLWEFIRDLLLNPQYNPSMICWENYDEGMFRFVHSDRVAKLWGSKKENEDMNYEKLSRAMRYYYKSQVLLPVYGKRLVYKFGPTATGWRSEHPIMRCQG